MRIALATMDKTPHLATTVGFVGNRSPTGRVVRLLFFGRWACSIRGAPQGAQPVHAGCGWRKNYHYDYEYDKHHDCDYGYADDHDHDCDYDHDYEYDHDHNYDHGYDNLCNMSLS